MLIAQIKENLAAKAQALNIQPVAPAAPVKQTLPTTKAAAAKKPVVMANPPVPVSKQPAATTKEAAPVKAQNQPMAEQVTTTSPKSPCMTQLPVHTVNPLEIEAVIRKILVAGRDYGQIKGFPKPSLFKSGAERLLPYFGYTTRAELVACTELWQDGFVAYTVKVTAMDRYGHEIGNGYGTCNSRERRFAKVSVFDAANCAIKLSVKRGICDVALRVCCASFFLGQDLEDLPVDTTTTRFSMAK